MTTTVRGIPVKYTLINRMACPGSAVNLDNIVTIKRSALAIRITMLGPEKMSRVRKAIIYALDLQEPA